MNALVVGFGQITSNKGSIYHSTVTAVAVAGPLGNEPLDALKDFLITDEKFSAKASFTKDWLFPQALRQMVARDFQGVAADLQVKCYTPCKGWREMSFFSRAIRTVSLRISTSSVFLPKILSRELPCFASISSFIQLQHLLPT